MKNGKLNADEYLTESIELLISSWEDIYKRAENSAIEEIKGTSLELLLNDEFYHPLKSDFTIFSEEVR